MRLRLTRNLEKPRGFVNGAIGETREVATAGICASVFKLATAEGVACKHNVFDTAAGCWDELGKMNEVVVNSPHCVA